MVTFDRLQQFITDSAPDKRAKYIEELLNSPEYVDKWTMFFGDLLKNNTDNTQVRRYAEGRNAFYAYIKSAVQNNKPYNVMVTEMLSGAGTNSWQQGELNWNIGGQVTGGPRTGQDNFDQMAANASEKFLGIAHFNCLLCHDGRRHLDTLSVWGKTATRMNAWEMASFFSRIAFRRVAATAVPGGPAYWEVFDNARAADYPLNTTTGNRPNRQPVGTLRNVTPRYPFAGDFKAAGSDNYRAVLAQAITSDIQFSRAAVNYVWKQFFARGIVEPVNQFDLARLDSKNPPPSPWTLQPTNADMLNALAADFQQSNYDIKQLIRNIVNSRAYQLSARYDGEWKADYEKYFARKFVRRLWAEEIVDAVAQTSRLGQSYNVTGLGTINWTMQLPETANLPGGQMTSFLDSFLRGNRVDEDRRDDGAIPQVLNLMNDSYVVTRSRASGNGATASLARALIMKYPNGNDRLLVNEMFLTVLNRPATDDEGRIATSALAQGASTAERQQKVEDLLWSLYNKVDFIFNY